VIKSKALTYLLLFPPSKFNLTNQTLNSSTTTI
jgi:hypothetical protein